MFSDLWNARSASRVLSPMTPFEGPALKPRALSVAWALRIVAAPYFDAPSVFCTPSAVSVGLSSLPVGGSFSARWKFTSAACVCGPMRPSTPPVLKPRLFSIFCTWRTVSASTYKASAADATEVPATARAAMSSE
jgi:hypothetical protein